MADLEERIGLVKDIKRFAVKRLGVSENPSFNRVGGVDVFHVLYASRTEGIESAIENKWGNRVYEDEDECKKDEEVLQSKGYDVLRMTWEAIGTEDCPITSSMLGCSKTRVAYLVLHENFHIHCRKNPARFSLAVEEAIADCFAYQGALLYFASNPSMAGHIRRDFREWQEFFDFANKYITRLGEAYNVDKSKGRRVLGDARREAEKLSSTMISKEVRERLALPINNAFFLRMQSYAPMARQVYEAFRDMDPREYVTNRRKLNAVLRRLCH